MSLFDFFGIVTNKRIYDVMQCNFRKILIEQNEIKQRNEEMAIDLTALIEQVQRNAEIDAAALTLISGLKAQIDALVIELADQPAIAAKIAELADALDASTDALAAAVITPPVEEEPVIEEPIVDDIEPTVITSV